jgi:hypothetical protein
VSLPRPVRSPGCESRGSSVLDCGRCESALPPERVSASLRGEKAPRSLHAGVVVSDR